MSEQKPPIVQLTLRGVPFLDELVYVVKSRASCLAADLGAVRRCAMVVSTLLGPTGTAYVAELQVYDDEGEATVQAAAADLFDAIEGAFSAARGYLMRTSAQDRLPALIT